MLLHYQYLQPFGSRSDTMSDNLLALRPFWPPTKRVSRPIKLVSLHTHFTSWASITYISMYHIATHLKAPLFSFPLFLYIFLSAIITGNLLEQSNLKALYLVTALPSRIIDYVQFRLLSSKNYLVDFVNSDTEIVRIHNLRRFGELSSQSKRNYFY